MVEILLFIATHCGFLFKPDGREFRFVDSYVSKSFGDAIVVLESGSVRVRFMRDRGQLTMEFQPVVGKKGTWHSLGLLRGALRGGRFESEDLNGEWANFLAESIGVLQDSFADPERREVMLEALAEQGRRRARQLFG